jgi:FRG domain
MGLLTEEITGKNLGKPWERLELKTVDDVFIKMAELQGKKWVSRGQAKYYGEQLLPPIDRQEFSHLKREKKIALEQKSFYLYRSTIKYFSDGEKETLYLNIPTLMLMQHNGVPTRLLDWSMSPFVSLYFACRNCYKKEDWQDGEIWAFDYHEYEICASRQWNLYPETQKATEKGREFDNEMPIIFANDEPKRLWFVLQFLGGEFSRLSAQHGLFSVVSKFGKDHAAAIQELLEDNQFYKRYLIKKELKKDIRRKLLKNYGIWEGSLFPDSTGVADAIVKEVYKLKK